MSGSLDTKQAGIYITQAQIDALLRSAAIPAASSSAIDLTPEPEAPADAETTGSMISQEDLDRLFLEIEASPEPAEPSIAPAVNPEADVISQDDIDRLLMGIDADTQLEAEDKATEPDPGGLISQDDIDALLQGAGETAPAVEKPLETSKSAPISQEDIDALFGAAPTASATDQVVLAPGDDALFPAIDEGAEQDAWQDLDDFSQPGQPTDEPAFEGGKKSRWYADKPLWVTVGIFALTLASVVWLQRYYAARRSAANTAVVMAFPIVMPAHGRNAALPPAPPAAKPEMVVLDGFVVPTPVQWEAMAYIHADIGLGLSDSKGAAEIKKHEAFFRFLIYRILTRIASASEKKAMNAASLGPMIQDALNRSLVRQPIRRVEIKRFEVM
jgi:flagellar basal body-associated protein FliL